MGVSFPWEAEGGCAVGVSFPWEAEGGCVVGVSFPWEAEGGCAVGVSFPWEAEGGGEVEGSSFLAEAGVVSFFRVVLLADFCAFFARKRIRASFSLLHSSYRLLACSWLMAFFFTPTCRCFLSSMP